MIMLNSMWQSRLITCSLASGLLLLSGMALGAAPDSSTESSTFPIWGDEARARGYSIPLPFGVNLSYMNIRQNINVDSITFSGLKLGDHLIPTDMFDIAVGQTRQRSKTENLRLDMWVFPFLNIYGLVGSPKARPFRMYRLMPTRRTIPV